MLEWLSGMWTRAGAHHPTESRGRIRGEGAGRTLGENMEVLCRRCSEQVRNLCVAVRMRVWVHVVHVLCQGTSAAVAGWTVRTRTRGTRTVNNLKKMKSQSADVPVGVQALGHAFEAARGVRGDGVPRLGPPAVEVVDAVWMGEWVVWVLSLWWVGRQGRRLHEGIPSVMSDLPVQVHVLGVEGEHGAPHPCSTSMIITVMARSHHHHTKAKTFP